MKFSIAKDQFASGLQSVQNIVTARTTLPILSNVLLRAEGDRLDLTATDLDVTIQCDVSADVAKEGTVTLPVKKLFSIVRELGSPELEIEVDDRSICSLRSGPSFFKINGLPAEEYPPVPEFEEQRIVVLPQETLRSMLRKTGFAVSTDETRYVLNGLFFSLKEHKLTLVATDGRRLALTDEEAEIDGDSQREFIVPTKAVVELGRLLHEKGQAEVRATENQVAFTLLGEDGHRALLISKLVEGTYPNYQQVIPKESKERISLVREELLLALRRAEIMTSDKANSVKLNFSRNQLSITANSPEVGEARENLAVNYKGTDFAVAFNPTFLLDALKALEDEEVFFELTDELSPGVLKINGPFLYVIMPMRMN